MGTKILDRDRGAEALINRITQALESRLSVGIHEAEGSETYENGMTVLQVGTLHEYGGTDENGNPSPPRRSFLGDWFDGSVDQRRADLRAVAVGILTGRIKSLEQGLEILGVRYVGQIQRRIKDGIPPPLAPSTIARKGSSTPLIDTGQLWTSITYKIEKE